MDTSALAANIEEGTHDLCTQVERRPLTLLIFLIFGTVTLFAGAGPMDAATHGQFFASRAGRAAISHVAGWHN